MNAARPKPNPLLDFRRSLSAQLLGLTVLCILFAQVVVLIPAVAAQRSEWLSARIEAAYLVGLALEAPEAEMIGPSAASQLFATANILQVTVSRGGVRIPIYSPDVDPSSARPMRYINLDKDDMRARIGDAWRSVLSRGDTVLRVVGRPAFGGAEEVDILVSESALRRDLLIFAGNVLWMSLVISTLTAGLIYLLLSRMIVRPVSRLTRNMAAFHQNPDDAATILALSAREDEIGDAERGLRALELRLHELLQQRIRLAALGAGISKISHDLRNILASAQLMSDRLAKSDDPRVAKLSPRLIQALDRAIALSRDTLSYARMEPSHLRKSDFDVRELLEEVLADNLSMHVDLRNEAPEGLTIFADRNQLYRALFNLTRNAVEAMTPQATSESPKAATLTARAKRDGNIVTIDLEDTGPGVPEDARAHLFEPFQGTSKPGGSGLGVAIALEIMRAHGGWVELVKSDASGATFRLTLPLAKPAATA